MGRNDDSADHNVVKYRRPIHVNIGLIIFAILFVYLLINVVIYLSKGKIAIYEVTSEKISDDSVVTGLILRNETVYQTDTAGYINYYYTEGSHISKNTPVYSVDENGGLQSSLKESTTSASLTAEDIQAIRDDVSAYVREYSDSEYYEVYSYQENLKSSVTEIAGKAMTEQLVKAARENAGSGTFEEVKSDQAGTISYILDGYETKKPEDLTADDFKESGYKSKRTSMLSTDITAAGSPVYKVVQDGDWSIVVPLSDSVYEQVKDDQYIKIRFTDDDVKATASIRTYKLDGKHYAVLGLTRHMVRYVSERFIKIELILNTAQGLKIPISSVIEKDFYTVPKEYIVKNPDDGNTSIYHEVAAEDGTKARTYTDVDVYYEDEDSGKDYIDMSVLTRGEYLYLPDSDDWYSVGEIGSLQGVYNVNKGYYVFRRVKVLYQNEEYYIVEDGTEHGLSAYDHIVVDAAAAKEDEVIY